ncbi:MAG: carboxypeptidase regulatory-like domain-containing protein [Gammaproteobacteria bacterium]|nr:carboxypeptidase regulatory-like domain-containing protein [Gammaproteobacteria bacterium]
MKRKTFHATAVPRAAPVWLIVLSLAGNMARAADAYLEGMVTGATGPEAGVWVIAETAELATPLVKIVVTDDAGRFVLPELPEATWRVWVRGYGLADSQPVSARPGAPALALRVSAAATPVDAAKVYPADYWLSLLRPPAADQFPGTGPGGNGIAPQLESQAAWINNLKSNCHLCHQFGNQVTRTLDHMAGLNLASSREAWDYRTQLGVRGGQMYAAFNAFGRDNAMQVFADWTDRIAAGAVPPAPPRPRGIERNVVITLWDWGEPTSYMHDEIATDKNQPTVNGGGPVYAVSSGHGKLAILDPATHGAREILIPTRDDPKTISSRFPPPGRPSNFHGNTHLWGLEHPADPHNPMLDRSGRVWLTSKIRQRQPDWCGSGSPHPFAQYYPLRMSVRQASFYDPRSDAFTLIDTCFSTHHLQFDNDADQTVYFNELAGPIIGWINTREFDRTRDEQAAQGWCPQVVDSNGDGRISQPWNLPGQTRDPSRDTEVRYNLYSVIPSPVDDSVWGTSESYPGYIVRIDRGANPPVSCIAEVYRVPEPGFDPRGIDVDSQGVIWTALAGSSHLASFDRRKCTPGTPEQALAGTHCAAGWTLYRTNGPTLAGTDVPADFQYYNWVDQHDISGLGRDTPFATGSNSDALLALDPASGHWTTLRVPYPLGFFHRGMDGRIDDPAAGWKGRALWANYGTHLLWHVEGGLGTRGKLVRFQIRQDPLAR